MSCLARSALIAAACLLPLVSASAAPARRARRYRPQPRVFRPALKAAAPARRPAPAPRPLVKITQGSSASLVRIEPAPPLPRRRWTARRHIRTRSALRRPAPAGKRPSPPALAPAKPASDGTPPAGGARSAPHTGEPLLPAGTLTCRPDPTRETPAHLAYAGKLVPESARTRLALPSSWHSLSDALDSRPVAGPQECAPDPTREAPAHMAYAGKLVPALAPGRAARPLSLQTLPRIESEPLAVVPAAVPEPPPAAPGARPAVVPAAAAEPEPPVLAAQPASIALPPPPTRPAGPQVTTDVEVYALEKETPAANLVPHFKELAQAGILTGEPAEQVAGRLRALEGLGLARVEAMPQLVGAPGAAGRAEVCTVPPAGAPARTYAFGVTPRLLPAGRVSVDLLLTAQVGDAKRGLNRSLILDAGGAAVLWLAGGEGEDGLLVVVRATAE